MEGLGNRVGSPPRECLWIMNYHSDFHQCHRNTNLLLDPARTQVLIEGPCMPFTECPTNMTGGAILLTCTCVSRVRFQYWVRASLGTYHSEQSQPMGMSQSAANPSFRSGGYVPLMATGSGVSRRRWASAPLMLKVTIASDVAQFKNPRHEICSYMVSTCRGRLTRTRLARPKRRTWCNLKIVAQINK